jgi:DNA-binding transcriptional LysR family regulator
MSDWLSAFARDDVDWTALQAFRTVARAGSFRSGAVLAGLAINTLRKRVDDVERIAGRPLLIRSIQGVALTPDGKALLSKVDAMAAILNAHIGG